MQQTQNKHGETPHFTPTPEPNLDSADDKWSCNRVSADAWYKKHTLTDYNFTQCITHAILRIKWQLQREQTQTPTAPGNLF